MMTAGVLQFSLISKQEWDNFLGRIDHLQRRSFAPVRSLSFTVTEIANIPMRTKFNRSASMPEDHLSWLQKVKSELCTLLPDSISESDCNQKLKVQ